MTAPTAATRLIALLGDPVSHSLSPTFQNAAFRAAGVDGVYLALRCRPDALPGLLRGIALAGGGGNVTVPHKQPATAALDRATPAVERTGACNTFWLEDGRVWGDNTDVQGFTLAAEELLGAPLRGARVLLIGAGGAARAVAWALASAPAAEVHVLNRTPTRAAQLAADFAGPTPFHTLSAPPALTREPFDLVVNATALGLHPHDPLPLSPDALPPGAAALDLVYSPEETPWVRALRTRGIPAADGREMLLQQGAAAFRRWWRREPSLDAMRRALRPPA